MVRLEPKKLVPINRNGRDKIHKAKDAGELLDNFLGQKVGKNIVSEDDILHSF